MAAGTARLGLRDFAGCHAGLCAIRAASRGVQGLPEKNETTVSRFACRRAPVVICTMNVSEPISQRAFARMYRAGWKYPDG